MRPIAAWVNPLLFLDVDGPATRGSAQATSHESVLAFMCPTGTSADLDTLTRRHREISPEPVGLFVVPAEARILDKLVWPLRHAKASYMVGNYLAVIALAGMVSEMVALLLWEVAEVAINGRAMEARDEQELFGRRFEKLGQEQRVRILSVYGLIDEATRARFDTVRETRRGYLHLWSQEHDSLPADAVKAYHAAVALVATLIGQEFREGKVVINNRLVKYLEARGVYGPREEPAV